MKDELTKEESDSIDNAICPDCGKEELYKGPKGGMMVNIYCKNCGSRFNIPDPDLPVSCASMKQRISAKSPNFQAK